MMMNLLKDKSKNIQFEAFHVFKVSCRLAGTAANGTGVCGESEQADPDRGDPAQEQGQARELSAELSQRSRGYVVFPRLSNTADLSQTSSSTSVPSPTTCFLLTASGRETFPPRSDRGALEFVLAPLCVPLHRLSLSLVFLHILYCTSVYSLHPPPRSKFRSPKYLLATRGVFATPTTRHAPVSAPSTRSSRALKSKSNLTRHRFPPFTSTTRDGDVVRPPARRASGQRSREQVETSSPPLRARTKLHGRRPPPPPQSVPYLPSRSPRIAPLLHSSRVRSTLSRFPTGELGISESTGGLHWGSFGGAGESRGWEIRRGGL